MPLQYLLCKTNCLGPLLIHLSGQEASPRITTRPPPRHIHRAFYYGYQERVDRPEILGNLEKHGRADCCVDTPAPVLMGRNFF